MIAAEIGPDLRLLTTDILRNRKFFQYYHQAIFCFVLSFKFPCIYYLIHSIDVTADFSSFYSMICFKNALFYRHGMLSASLNLLEHSSGRIDPCQVGVESPMSLTVSNTLTDTSHWCRILV